MRKIPTTREQVLAAWDKTREAANRLTVATEHVGKLPFAHDMVALESEMNAFRLQHAEEKRRREVEFLAAQRRTKEMLDAVEEVKRAQKALDIAKRDQEKIEKNYTKNDNDN